MQQPIEYYSNNDEIDLFELIEKLWQEKRVIVILTLLAVIIATVVALLLPRTYSASAVINQPTNSQLAPINSVRPLISVSENSSGDAPVIAVASGMEVILTRDDVYDIYRTQLTNYRTYQHAFEYSLLAKNANSQPEKQRQIARTTAFETFQNNISVNFDTSRENKTSRITIQYSSESAEESAYMINDVILPYVNQIVVGQLEKNRKTLINQEINYLKQHIQNLEQSFISNNLAEYEETEEALTQAKAANISALSPDLSPNSLTQFPFFLGTDLLSSNLKVIGKRESQYRFFSNPRPDDTGKPYIRGVPENIRLIRQLEKVDTQFADVLPVTIERPAVAPVTPIKPNKKIIVLVGLVLGGMLGLFLALIRISIRSRKEKKQFLEDQTLLK